jgi:glucokinase
LSLRLVADVGGTNVRLALFDESSGRLSELQTRNCTDYPNFADAIASYLGNTGAKPDSACFAVAAIIAGDWVDMTNADWQFSCRALEQQFGFSPLVLINDFEAIALSLPRLQSSQLVSLTPELAFDDHDLIAIGPGTGLGGALLRKHSEVIACEPGHAGLSPATALELELFAVLQADVGEVYAELLLSGPGLQRLYRALAQVKGRAAEPLAPHQISERAVAGTDPLCMQALDTFCALLGSAAGNFALSSGCYGGCYLAGGILPRIVDYLQQSSFRQRFADKGAMRATLQQVAIAVIVEPNPGLLGAASMPLE